MDTFGNGLTTLSKYKTSHVTTLELPQWVVVQLIALLKFDRMRVFPLLL